MVKLIKRKPVIKYSGSAIQQDHGESIDGHGFLEWDLKSRKSKLVTLPNDYGYYTFHLINGKCDIPDNLPKNLRIRVKYENTPVYQLEDFKKLVSEKYKIVEMAPQKISTAYNSVEARVELLGDSRDVEYQNGILRKYLSANPQVTEDDIIELSQLNHSLNKKLPVQSAIRSVTWKPIKLEFSNMFSYGEGNYIDFTNFQGLYGIFAENYSGKSALFDILTFAIYDKSTRASKASHVLNNRKDTFYCKFVFELSGQLYHIERVGTKNEKTGSVKVDVNFWTEEDGVIVTLNREDRDKTNFAIRDFLGTYEDFVMTSLSTQYENQNFVDTTQKDRKELLYKFLDIFIYDDLFKLAKEDSKEYQVLIKDLEREDLNAKVSLILDEIKFLNSELQVLNLSVSNAQTEVKYNNEVLMRLNKEYASVDFKFSHSDIQTQMASCIAQRDNAVLELKNIAIQEDSLKKEKETLSTIIAKMPSSNYPALFEKYKLSQIEVSDSKKKYETSLAEYNAAQTKKEHLDKHEYDPNCKYCTSNEFVREAKLAIEAIPNLLEKYTIALDSHKEHILRTEQIEKDLTISREYDTVVKKLDSINSKMTLLQNQKEAIKFKGKTLQSQLKEWKTREDDYFKFSALIEKNAKIEEDISKFTFANKEAESTILQLQDQHRKKYSEIERLEQDLDHYNSKLEKYLDYKKKYRIYELYLQTMSRDGIPYKILETVLPVIENEVNQILNQVVDFTVRLEAADEKYLHAYIVYDENKYWPVELTSGMERFVLSLAFRASLTEITTLPKTNFLAIDEGFGVLDQKNIMAIGKLFSYLKQQYEYLVIVSHIDSMRDLVDKTLTIEKVDGYSKLEAG